MSQLHVDIETEASEDSSMNIWIEHVIVLLEIPGANLLQPGTHAFSSPVVA